MTRLNADRVYLRPYRDGDGPMYLEAGLRNRKHLERFELGNPLNHLGDLAAAENLVRDFADAWQSGEALVFGVFDQISDIWLGQVYISPTNRDLPEFAIGFVVDSAHEGRGYMTEAVRIALGYLFDECGAHRIRSECADTNNRSWRLLERCGFIREGHLRESRRDPDGSIRGDYQYGLLRSEFGGGT